MRSGVRLKNLEGLEIQRMSVRLALLYREI